MLGILADIFFGSLYVLGAVVVLCIIVVLTFAIVKHIRENWRK